MRALALTLALALLAGCATKPIQPPKVVEVVVTKIVPVPKELSKDCERIDKRDNTTGEAVRLANARKAALDECSARMAQIRKLVP